MKCNFKYFKIVCIKVQYAVLLTSQINDKSELQIMKGDFKMESKKEIATLNDLFDEKKCIIMSIYKNCGNIVKDEVNYDFPYFIMGVKKINGEVLYDYCSPKETKCDNRFLYAYSDSKKHKWSEMLIIPETNDLSFLKNTDAEIEFAFACDGEYSYLWLVINNGEGEIRFISNQYNTENLENSWEDICIYTSLFSKKIYEAIDKLYLTWKEYIND